MSSSNLIHVGDYERVVAASLARVWENVLDWEHLPWLHQSSFEPVACEDAGAWGWRLRVGKDAPGALRIELRVDRDASRYVVRTLAGPLAGSEIWTHLAAENDSRTQVSVSFHVPNLSPDAAAGLARAYTALYTRLWDEDEAMMIHREHALAAQRAARGAVAERVELGPRDALRARLPLTVVFARREFRLVELDGEVAVHATACPHWLGPLGAAPVENGAVRCPWHGYRFDLRKGHCLDVPGLALPPPPRLVVSPDGTQSWLEADAG